MANVNDNEFKPELGAAFWPGREIATPATQRIAENHNFLVTRSGHTHVRQTGAGESISVDATFRPFAYYVVRLLQRGGGLRMRMAFATVTATTETRFIITDGVSPVTSSTGTFGGGYECAGTPGASLYDKFCVVRCDVRDSAGGAVIIRELTIDQAPVTNNPFTTQTRLYGLDNTQWGTTDAPLDARAVAYAADTTQTLHDGNWRPVVSLCAWNNYGLTPAPTVSLGTTGKAAQEARERIVAGMHMGQTGQRSYYVFATGRNSASVTATYSMAVQGYADASFGFTITGNSNTVFTYGSWPAWDDVFKWVPRTNSSPWDMVATIAATNFTYLQALTILEAP